MAVAEPNPAITPTTLTPGKGEWLRLPHRPVSGADLEVRVVQRRHQRPYPHLVRIQRKRQDLREDQHFGRSVAADAGGVPRCLSPIGCGAGIRRSNQAALRAFR
jgi:hypothetical protein